MTNEPQKIDGPEDAPTSKGPNATAMGAIALEDTYYETGLTGKEKQGMPEAPTGPIETHEGVLGTIKQKGSSAPPRATFRGTAGQMWSFTGKRARVITMLAVEGEGLTQWDTLPWHTRLGGTIHALRCGGLEIETVREGPCRHARYWLRTIGTLLPGGKW